MRKSRLDGISDQDIDYVYPDKTKQGFEGKVGDYVMWKLFVALERSVKKDSHMPGNLYIIRSASFVVW